MTRRLYNWTFDDVIEFLKEHGFVFLKYLRGSHQHWVKHGDGADRIVEVNMTHYSSPPRTLKRMIRQSGIDQNEWIDWAGS